MAVQLTDIDMLQLAAQMAKETRLLSEAELIAHGATMFGQPTREHLYVMSEHIADLKAQLSLFVEDAN
jgi:hypothetical protein